MLRAILCRLLRVIKRTKFQLVPSEIRAAYLEATGKARGRTPRWQQPETKYVAIQILGCLKIAYEDDYLVNSPPFTEHGRFLRIDVRNHPQERNHANKVGLILLPLHSCAAQR